MFHKQMNNKATRKILKPLLLVLGFGGAMSFPLSAGLASDYCYMRTAEGQYIELNDICGQPAQPNAPRRIESPEPAAEPTEAETTTTVEIIRRSTSTQPTESPDDAAETPADEPTEEAGDTPSTEADPTAEETPTSSGSDSEEATSESSGNPDALNTDGSQDDEM